MTQELDLVDTSITPDPWQPVAGDTYKRPTPMGWDRVVIMGVEPAGIRPAMHDINENVPVPCMVTFVDSGKAETFRKNADSFRAWLVCFGLRPDGRLREKPAQ